MTVLGSSLHDRVSCLGSCCTGMLHPVSLHFEEPCLQDVDGWTPLHHACFNGNSGMVKESCGVDKADRCRCWCRMMQVSSLQNLSSAAPPAAFSLTIRYRLPNSQHSNAIATQAMFSGVVHVRQLSAHTANSQSPSAIAGVLHR